MISPLAKMTSIALIAAGVTACGGGGGGSSSGSSSSGSSSVASYVAGDFKSASANDYGMTLSETETGQYSPSLGSAYGERSNECTRTYNDYYFESANTVVYGDPSLPQTDFMHAATLAESQFTTALSAFGLTIEEFNSYRPRYTSNVYNLLSNHLLNRTVDNNTGEVTNPDITDIDSDFSQPANWNSMDNQEKYRFVSVYWKNAGKEKQDEIIDSWETYHGTTLVVTSKIDIPEKILICLDRLKNGSQWGEGTLAGVNVAPRSLADRGDAAQVMLHELIHTIQVNIVGNYQSGLDRWFAEGQAVYFAGQQRASSYMGAYPVDVVTLTDETNNFISANNAYGHYSLAYSHVHANTGPSVMLQLLLDMRNDWESTESSSEGQSSEAFEKAFDANILKSDGSSLTLGDFRTNYEYYMGGGL